MTTLTKQTLSHLDWLESEAIHIMREVAGQCSNPVLLFSGGKDSICMLRIAEKAFRPGKFPFPLMHIDTGHNYQEVVQFRDKRAAELGVTFQPYSATSDAPEMLVACPACGAQVGFWCRAVLRASSSGAEIHSFHKARVEIAPVVSVEA
jgi:3'-phosphoadenosine 5'-phosphosulfate sulfotransferase (PAPS reductase)/FAD synthetase